MKFFEFFFFISPSHNNNIYTYLYIYIYFIINYYTKAGDQKESRNGLSKFDHRGELFLFRDKFECYCVEMREMLANEVTRECLPIVSLRPLGPIRISTKSRDTSCRECINNVQGML